MDARISHEIAHGQCIARTGEGVWNWSSPAGQLRWRRRVAMFNRFLHDVSGTALEIGCGTGLFTGELSRMVPRLVAIDISEDLLQLARQRVEAPNVVFALENAYATTFSPESFQAIAGSSVLHHLEVERALREFHRLLVPGGRIMFTEPNMLNPQIAIQKQAPCIKKWMGDSPDETAFIRWRIARQLVKAGFSDVSVSPFDFLHPAIPKICLSWAAPVCAGLDRLPVVKEFAGSLVIQAFKPPRACPPGRLYAAHLGHSSRATA